MNSQYIVNRYFDYLAPIFWPSPPPTVKETPLVLSSSFFGDSRLAHSFSFAASVFLAYETSKKIHEALFFLSRASSKHLRIMTPIYTKRMTVCRLWGPSRSRRHLNVSIPHDVRSEPRHSQVTNCNIAAPLPLLTSPFL